MKRASHWSDWAELRKLDVAFHHEFCKASENEIVLSLWEALARRINIIFGQEIASERNFQVVVNQHEKLISLFEMGDPSIEDANRLFTYYVSICASHVKTSICKS